MGILIMIKWVLQNLCHVIKNVWSSLRLYGEIHFKKMINNNK